MSLRNKLDGFRAIWRFDNKWELLLSRTLLRRQPLAVYRMGGMDILVGHGGGDPSGLREVLVSPMYRQFLGHLEGRGPLNVLDLGAGAGGFPLLLRARGFRLKRLACVELNPTTFSRLRFNLERNLECALHLFPAAVCARQGPLDVLLGAGSTGDSIYGAADVDARPCRVQGLTFDHVYDASFQGEVVDVCKIDIEGAEYEVFDGAHHQAVARCRHLIIEIHGREGRRVEEVVAELERCGFALLPRQAHLAPDVYFFGNTRLGA